MRQSLVFVICGLVVACGGNVERAPTSHEEPTSPAPKTPSSTAGGGGGGASSSNTAGEASQCDGYPECNPGEEKVDACFPDFECFERTACGVTIRCQTICEGPRPQCDAGDTEVASQLACGDAGRCYSRKTCNLTIWCAGS